MVLRWLKQSKLAVFRCPLEWGKTLEDLNLEKVKGQFEVFLMPGHYFCWSYIKADILQIKIKE